MVCELSDAMLSCGGVYNGVRVKRGRYMSMFYDRFTVSLSAGATGISSGVVVVAATNLSRVAHTQQQ